ncbi:MAG TPA: SCO family protein, partial [Pyrinomonadaceae bacterium]|nr:SCO family protein [Pyrinomonadaceae bacterium]
MSFRTLLSSAARAALLLTVTLAFVAPAYARHDGHGPAKPRQTAARYTCPMHPEMKSAKPGSCPKCKMDLRPSREGVAATETHGAAHGGSAASDNSRMSIPDVELLDQDGRRVRFYTDLVKGKVVAVNFVFTTCTTVCPPLGATFARVQRELGERAGRDVRLISISVDPATDTPERLKAWGGKFKAGPGWTLLTGAKPQVDELLRALGAATASPSDHTPTVLVGNDARGQWTRAYGLAPPSKLVQLINDAAEGRL